MFNFLWNSEVFFFRKINYLFYHWLIFFVLPCYLLYLSRHCTGTSLDQCVLISFQISKLISSKEDHLKSRSLFQEQKLIACLEIHFKHEKLLSMIKCVVGINYCGERIKCVDKSNKKSTCHLCGEIEYSSFNVWT